MINSSNRSRHTSKKTTSYALLVRVVLFLLAIPLIAWVVRQGIIQWQKIKAAERNSQVVEEYQQNQNPETLQQKMDRITPSKTVQASAKQIAADLGTMYSNTDSWWDKWNPRGWTENDKAVADELIFQRNNFKYLVKMYPLLVLNGDLKKDIIKLLDSKELKRVRKYLTI